MGDPAYIRLTPDGYWALYYGDGMEETPYILAQGRAFEPGPGIQEAVEELEAWARESGYDVILPEYGLSDLGVADVIEPEIFDEVFGPDDSGS